MLYLTGFVAAVMRKNPSLRVLCLSSSLLSLAIRWIGKGICFSVSRGTCCSLFALFQTKVGGTSHTGGSFEEVLSSTAHASAQSSLAGTRLPESEEELQC